MRDAVEIYYRLKAKTDSPMFLTVKYLQKKGWGKEEIRRFIQEMKKA